MLNAAEALRGSLPVWSLLSVLDSLLAISGCAMLSYVFFRIPVRRKPLPWIVCAALVVAFAAAEPAALRVDSDGFAVIWSALGMMLPFGAMALMFRGKGLWKPMLAVAGYSFVEGACFVIVMAVFGFDYTDRNDTLELLVRVAVDVLFFGAALFLFTRRLNRRSATLDVTGTGVALYLMVVLSFSVFISTLLIIGPSISATKRIEYLLLLLNIPVISATVRLGAQVTYHRPVKPLRSFLYEGRLPYPPLAVHEHGRLFGGRKLPPQRRKLLFPAYNPTHPIPRRTEFFRGSLY